MPDMRWLEARVPPPAVMLIAALLIWAIRRTWPELGLFIPGRRAIYWTLLVVGVVVAVAGVFEFRRVRTTVNPMRPANASSLVTSGIYRFTRNPMYVGDVLILLAVVVFFSHPLGLAGVVLFVAWMNLLQIPAEERALRERFGEAYDAYCARVRRWI
jgi:protein-S-isoprenylcysteine O-methyltransferase Ste14